ncbi:MAG: carbamoyltransferase HypF [Acidobacteria bacterium]|nr:carbamoyltransferase HypF [Acidobacteriota bacterium]
MEVPSARRLRLHVRGAVQGVGFRPAVYRLATEMGLAGWVINTPQGVTIEVEGTAAVLGTFLQRLEADRPPRSSIQGVETSYLDPTGCSGFEIRHSDAAGAKTAIVLPDIATCPDCLSEVFDPANRRYRYPFTNCTNCGPRYSIIDALPYDRPNTTMRAFAMCQQCRCEYEDPRDRRFHAQPNACPECGPRLELRRADGGVVAIADEALIAAARAIAGGTTVAVKGIGGFHLIADARNHDAVRRLRAGKHREEKPFATMFPSVASVRDVCEVSPVEERLLCSPEAPIVLLRRLELAQVIAPSVAPGNPYLGVLLPYAPLHHLLMAELGFPAVATSGNLSDEPICTDENDARHRLAGIADLFLVHNRAIARHVDDSIVRIMAGRELVLRRARGYAPMPQQIPGGTEPVLAVGAHLKNTVAIATGNQVFTSQHIGDLETAEAYAAFEDVIGSLTRMYDVEPRRVACDLHPDYLSTRYAFRSGLAVTPVQHHYAHVLSCMAENDLAAPALGVAWDGTGYGLDGTVWGGEFLRVSQHSFERIAHLRSFRLPGGEKAVREPRRSALGLLFEALGSDALDRMDLAPVNAFPKEDRETMRAMLQAGLNAPLTSSAGRLFDAVASLCDLRHVSRYEGQAAMELEFALDGRTVMDHYPFSIGTGTPAIIDWAPMILSLIEDLRRGATHGAISAKFHNTLVETIVSVTRMAGLERVVLTGGCFQNKYLCERAVDRLTGERFNPYWHRRIPPNDGGIALGQIMGLLRGTN